MNKILLSICIPTYNRRRLLQQTLEVLLPTLTDEAEVVVLDNCSPDDTWEYLESLGSRIHRVRHPSNIGPDANHLGCLAHGTGNYVWILSDDDFPCSNTVRAILEAIISFKEPTFLFLRSEWQDEQISRYTSVPVQTRWRAVNRDGFLKEVGIYCTALSSIVVRRGCIDEDFVKRCYGTNLVPASISLSAAAKHDRVIVSEKPLIICRGNELLANRIRVAASQRELYLMIFTRNLRRFLRTAETLGFSKSALRHVYADSLVTIVFPFLHAWLVSWRGFRTLVLSSYDHKVFYSVGGRFLGGFIRRKCRNLVPTFKGPRQRFSKFAHWMIWRIVRKVLTAVTASHAEESYVRICASLDELAKKSFSSQVSNLGNIISVRHPVYLKNPKYFHIGNGFVSGPGLRMEAWDTFAGETFRPRIIVGNNVGLNWNVHIGAIDRVEIHDNVLIGSNVLITDHNHGQMVAEECDLPPCSRRLVSKGPVIIKENVWIGENVSILSNVTIGEGAVIGSNSLVNKSVPAYTVVGGVPAKVLKHLR